MKTKLIIAFLLLFISNQFTRILFSQEVLPEWSWPITSDYGPRKLPSFDFHEGVDFSAASGDEDYGTPIPSIESGLISEIGRLNNGSIYQIRIDGAHGEWTYLHIFRTGVYIKNNWELNFGITLENPNPPYDTKTGNVIILWSGNQAAKVLAIAEYTGYLVLKDGDYINGTDSYPILTDGSVMFGEQIAPMGDSGTGDAHVHLGLNYPEDNPFLHLQHSPDGLQSVTIENPPDNHIFTQTELNSNYQIKVLVNSTAGLDLDNVNLWIYKNNDPGQLEHLGVAGEKTFGYGGTSELNPTASAKTYSTGGNIGVEPLDADTTLSDYQPGLDRFYFLQNLSSLNLPEGEHTLVVKTKDVNGHEVETSHHFVIDTTPPIVNAGPDRFAGTQVTLYGAAVDSSGINTYSWAKIAGTGNIIFGSANSGITTVSADTVGSYTLRLTATDKSGNSEYDEMLFIWNTDTTDTDDDGMPDWWENQNNLNPNQDDASLDPDGDELTNLQEYLNGKFIA